MSSQEELLPSDALNTIARGAPSYKGHKRAIPHAFSDFFMLYATSSGSHGGTAEAETDRANTDRMFTRMSTMKRCGRGSSKYPWQTIEQPSWGFYWGRLPGTTTLNAWISRCSHLPPPMELRPVQDLVRPMSLEHVCERLQELERGLEDDDPALLYQILYKRILRDPDKGWGLFKRTSARVALECQITDLIEALSQKGRWIDFSDPKNQVVTRFIFNKDDAPDNVRLWTKFLHQVLLSLELELRITSKKHKDDAAEKLSQQLPPTIQWSIAVAKRWKSHVRILEYGPTPFDIFFRFRCWKVQLKELKKFAKAMKWPNLEEATMEAEFAAKTQAFQITSSDTLAYFSLLVLPGQSLSFITMNTLIDFDPDPATDNLAMLSPLEPSCGFQYRGSHTYWLATCIVGKVLAPTCRDLAGWIGPACPTADLRRSQIARIRQQPPRPMETISPEDVESMAERSDALGPPADAYPVSDYQAVLPNVDDVIDTVRVELLRLTPVQDAEGTSTDLFDAIVQVAIAGASYSFELTYNVAFIAAWPCSGGPHLLFFDYEYERIRVDDIVEISSWGGIQDRPETNGANDAETIPEVDARESEKVLVVATFGVPDNDVLARAWCAHWGLSAVVADVSTTCVSCAVREAYAAAVKVVILMEHRDDTSER